MAQCTSVQTHSKQSKPHSNPSAPILRCFLLFLLLFLSLSLSLSAQKDSATVVLLLLSTVAGISSFLVSLSLSLSLRKKRFSQFCFLTGVYRWSVPSGVSKYEVLKPKSRPFYTVRLPIDGAILLWYSGARRWRNLFLNHLFSGWSNYIAHNYYGSPTQ